MIRLLALLIAAALAPELVEGPAEAQQPSPAQMGLTPTSPQVLETLDSSRAWVPIGRVDPVNHVFTVNGAGTDVRAFGCVADGATDQTACIQNALANAQDCVIIPASASGFKVSGTLTVPKCLRGTSWTPHSGTLGFAGTSALVCSNQAAQPCVTVNGASKLAVQIQNVTLTGGVATTAVNGSIGLQWTAGSNLVLDNVQFDNFGSCVYLGPTAANQIEPIAVHARNLMLGRCRKHYLVNDGVPEVYLSGGRFGDLKGQDYATADDFIFSTQTTPSGGGGGPNTLVVDAVQLNGGPPGCAFRWGGFRPSPSGAFNANKITGSHVEALGSAYTGSATRGFFCVDNTVPLVPGMTVVGNELIDDSATKVLPPFNIDPAVNYGNDARITFIGNEFLAAATTLNIHNEAFFFGPTLVGNWFFQPVTFTAGDASATALLTNNTFFSGYSIGGNWNALRLTQNQGTMTDTATGKVYMTGDSGRAFTPTLTFGGASVGMTYAAQSGVVSRTANGGYSALVVITLSNKGTSTGNAQINGLPLTCAGGGGITVPNLNGMTGLTGAVEIQLAGGATNAFVMQAAATSTGLVSLTDANFTNSSAINVILNCGTAS